MTESRVDWEAEKENQQKVWDAQEAERQSAPEDDAVRTEVKEAVLGNTGSPGLFRRMFEKGDISPRNLRRRLSIHSDPGESSTAPHTHRRSASDLLKPLPLV
ncbi:hypothetical protein H2200_002860 [Cladophialophora chaetospira]|uniref:Uncharacterized protein n=1 Tax=Cladophialophora chaetospira TaxID=386627 RepID=A0AA39CKY5_9EURO|nr:hypothetical protein H2200_002860 [Cladophialophora chaetospira]